jgi:preprotein translocase subunit SecE
VPDTWKDPAVNSFFAELVQTGIYKRSQGRIARQASFAALAISALLGFYRFQMFLITTMGLVEVVAWGIVIVATAFCCWIAFRLVNWPRFADFLIAVEAEMAKVSWPSRRELIQSSIVVLVNMVLLAALLWVFDAAWFAVFKHIIPLF